MDMFSFISIFCNVVMLLIQYRIILKLALYQKRHNYFFLQWKKMIMAVTQCLFIRLVLFTSVVQFSSVQSLSCVRFFATPWTAAHQASLSTTNSCPPKPMSIESVVPSNHLILCHPLFLLPPIFPSIRVCSNESTLCMRWPAETGVSASASVLPVNTQDWSPLGWTG